jgi:hypothetical protein
VAAGARASVSPRGDGRDDDDDDDDDDDENISHVNTDLPIF